MSKPRKTRHDLPSRVYHKHGAYYFVDKANKWHKLGTALGDAMKAYGDLLESDSALTTMRQLFDRYQREVVPKKAPKTQRDNVYGLSLLRQAFGHVHPEQIMPKHIYAYMDARKAPIAANREKALLSNVFSYAVRWGVASDNPCRLVKRNPEKARKRYVTDEEFKAIYDMATPPVQVIMNLALMTGLRMGDVLSLQLQAITDTGLEVRTAKTGKRLLFEWTPELRAAVDRAIELRGDAASMFLICSRRGHRYTEDGFKSIWQRLMRKCVADDIIKERFQFRDLRGKTGSDAEDDNLLGHADNRTLYRHYKRKPQKVTPLRPKILDSR